jgi:diguanylate cyclase (GGDEF)-like protein
VLVDTELPDGSGYELVERIRATPGAEATVVLLVGGAATVLDRVEAIHCGADGLFEKPLDAEAVGRRLQQLVERADAAAPRVLSVEDDPDQAVLIRSYLESAGYEVSVATGPREFEEAMISFRPDLVLMDILLPGGVSGYDLARYLRQDERYATLPILFLTSQRQMDVRIEAVKAGGDDHLAKPIVPGLLLSTVAARIERARLLKDLLERDGLTRLLAHTAFLERVRAAHGRRARHPDRPQAALVELDLDHFKKVNDTWGHPAGDRVLTALSGLLRSRLRQSDSIGRLGGEEFGILIEDLTPEEAERLVNRLREDFAGTEHRGPDGATFRASFSAGIAMSSGMPDLPGWLGAADAALYEAKKDGRNRVAVYRPADRIVTSMADRRPGDTAEKRLEPIAS